MCIRDRTKPIQPPQPLYDVLIEKAKTIEAIEFKFRAGSVELTPGQESLLVRAVAEMKELLRLAEADRTGLDITIEVHAYTDEIGGEAYNQKLRENRAREMSLWLGNAGVDTRRLKPVVPTPVSYTHLDVYKRQEQPMPDTITVFSRLRPSSGIKPWKAARIA